MTLLATIYQTSLSDPPATSAIAALSDWVSGLVFGPLATLLAVIAVAWLGFGMLTGRLDIRRGLAVLLGCFLVFGAQTIALALRGYGDPNEVKNIPAASSQPDFRGNDITKNNKDSFDPYAGASVLQK